MRARGSDDGEGYTIRVSWRGEWIPMWSSFVLWPSFNLGRPTTTEMLIIFVPSLDALISRCTRMVGHPSLFRGRWFPFGTFILASLGRH